MNIGNDASVLEALEIYMDLVERQDEIIRHLSEIVKRQATDIMHMKNLEENIDFKRDLCVGMAEDVIDEYSKLSNK